MADSTSSNDSSTPAGIDDLMDVAGKEQARPRRSVGARLVAVVKEFVIVVGLAVMISLVIKTWLFQAFFIPSASMEDTLIEDDRVVVSKLTPGPFDLTRGDIVVFEDPGESSGAPWLNEPPTPDRGVLHKALTFVGILPDESKHHLIKRVIGLPGDRVAADGEGKLSVNGVPITETYLKAGVEPSARAFDIVVPAGRLWVMGDNRPDSSDSRFHDDGTGATGSVPISDVTGRAVATIWPVGRFTVHSQPSDVFAKVPSSNPAPTDSATKAS